MQSICQRRQRLHEMFLIPAALLAALATVGCASRERTDPRTPLVAEQPDTPQSPPLGEPLPSESALCVRAGATCFQSFEAACEALRCPEARCVKRSYPAEVHCSENPVQPSVVPDSLEQPSPAQ